jgi:ABC-2 type transport system permease protein
MISALFYLQYHSVRNRLLMRVKRLKQPKYLLGGIVGGLYFYWYFFRTMFGVPARSQAAALFASAEGRTLCESIGALLLFIIVLLAWIVPHQRAALTFTEAEVAFLFPAPISRRGLIHFKLLRSQTAILFTTLLLTLVTNRFGHHAGIRAAGWWLILSTLNLHLLGSSFALSRLFDRGITTWKRRTAILALGLAFVAVLLVWISRTMPAFNVANLRDFDTLKHTLREVLTSGPLPYLLLPFRLVVRPFLAQSLPTFLYALAPALLLMLLHYAWVVRSDVAFEEASVEASRKMAEKLAAVRAGNWAGARNRAKVRRPPFKLRPLGPPAVAFLWKNLISAAQTFTWRVWLSLGVFGVFASIGLSQGSHGQGLRSALGILALMFMMWSLLIGPQFFRQDFRQDLAVADLLKTYPVRGWQLALGELLAPALILTAIQWLLLFVTFAGLAGLPSGPLGIAGLLAFALGAALLLPVLNIITLQIPNAAALLFPAWFQVARGGPHGIEAAGQRLIFMLGQMLAFTLALLPPAALSVGVFFLVKLFLSMAPALLLASLTATGVLAVEAALGIVLLGRLFERFDVSAELN